MISQIYAIVAIEIARYSPHSSTNCFFSRVLFNLQQPLDVLNNAFGRLQFMRLLFTFLIFFLGFNSTTAKAVENGKYISNIRGLILKCALLTVQDDKAILEVFVRWQGVWIPAINYGKTDYYQVETLIKNEEGFVSNNTRIKSKKKLIGVVRKSVLGKMKFHFQKVNEFPEAYLTIQQQAKAFVNKEKQ